jgi:hypothetical protein
MKRAKRQAVLWTWARAMAFCAYLLLFLHHNSSNMLILLPPAVCTFSIKRYYFAFCHCCRFVAVPKRWMVVRFRDLPVLGSTCEPESLGDYGLLCPKVPRGDELVSRR